MAYLMLILASAFWGGNYVVSKVMVLHLLPGVLAEARWLLASLLLVVIYHRNLIAEFKFFRESFWRTLFLALFGPVLFPTCLYIGLQYTTAVNAAMFLSASPALVLLINAVVFKDTITRANILGVLCSTFGVLYLLAHGNVSQITRIPIGKGDLWALASAGSWAVYCSFLRVKDKRMSSGGFMTISAVLGALMLIPLALVETNFQASLLFPHITMAMALGGLYLALFPSIASYMLWNKGISIIGSTRGEIYTHFIPFFGVVFSVIFLKTPLYAYDLVSGAFIVSGIVLSSRSFRSPQESPVQAIEPAALPNDRIACRCKD
ncbi:MAG: DMT family transporter [Pseudomonadota bacterium]